MGVFTSFTAVLLASGWQLLDLFLEEERDDFVASLEERVLAVLLAFSMRDSFILLDRRKLEVLFLLDALLVFLLEILGSVSSFGLDPSTLVERCRTVLGLLFFGVEGVFSSLSPLSFALVFLGLTVLVVLDGGVASPEGVSVSSRLTDRLGGVRLPSALGPS